MTNPDLVSRVAEAMARHFSAAERAHGVHIDAAQAALRAIAGEAVE